MTRVRTLQEMRDEVRRLEQGISDAEWAEARARSCEVCGEPEHAECFVDVHEKAARDDERRAMATWLRSSEALAIVNDAVFSSTESVVEACDALASALERR